MFLREHNRWTKQQTKCNATLLTTSMGQEAVDILVSILTLRVSHNTLNIVDIMRCMREVMILSEYWSYQYGSSYFATISLGQG